MSAPRILADASIPHVGEALSGLARLVLLDHEGWASVEVRDGDLLAVRTTTRVDQTLLGSARPGLVVTASAGTDHLDLPWLARQGVPVASAPGCNAEAVAQWVTAVVLELEGRGLVPAAAPVGVVGLGQTGSRVSRNLRALEHRVLACDPFVPGPPEGPPLVELEMLLSESTLVSLHVPLTDDGPYPTRGVIGGAQLGVGPRALVNASRGEVTALPEATKLPPVALALDVWPGEPELDWRLLEHPGAVVLGSPHVAGYSLEGKIAATRAVHEAVSRALGRQPTWTGRHLLPPLPELDLRALPGDTPRDRLRRLLRLDCDPWPTDRALRELAQLPRDQRAAAFRRLRATYPLRREPGARRLRGASADTIPPAWLQALGYGLA